MTTPTPESPGEPESLVTLTRCETLMDADSLRSRLSAAGIESWIPDEALMQTVGWNLNTYGFVRVQVSSCDYESAKTVHELIKQESLNPVDDKSEPIVNRAEIPLSSGMKTFALIIPIFTCAGFALYALAKNGYVRQGCDRKARELGTWFVAGIVVWFLLIAILTTRAR